jgi:hypothetical protein
LQPARTGRSGFCIAERFGRHVVLPPGAADVITLFVAHAHGFRVAKNLQNRTMEKTITKTASKTQFEAMNNLSNGKSRVKSRL